MGEILSVAGARKAPKRGLAGGGILRNSRLSAGISAAMTDREPKGFTSIASIEIISWRNRGVPARKSS